MVHMEEVKQYKRIVYITRLSAIGDVIIASNGIYNFIENGYFAVFITSQDTLDIALRIKKLEAFICYQKEKQPNYYINGNEVDSLTFFNYLANITTTKSPIYIDLQHTNRSKRVYSYLRNKLKLNFDKKYTISKFTFYRIFLVIIAFFSFKQKRNEKKIKYTRIKNIQKNLIQKIILNDHEKFIDTFDMPPFKQATHYFPDSMKYICLFPGASSFIKMWPKENFRDLISALKEDPELHIVICGSKNEVFLGEYLDFPQSKNVINLIHKTKLSETLNIIAYAKYIVTNDSFAAHAADNYNIPGSVFFGSTSPKFGFVPSSKDIKIEYLNLNCSPCSRHGKNACRYMNLKCLKEIKSDAILQQIFNKLN